MSFTNHSLASLPKDQRAKALKRSGIVRKTPEQIKAQPLNDELERLKAMKDSDIDFSDIPPLTDEQIAHFKPIKKQVTMRLDSDVILVTGFLVTNSAFQMQNQAGRMKISLLAVTSLNEMVKAGGFFIICIMRFLSI
ncbi:BrnA antitoxin family protein [Moraxella caviae]|nr:BrnA antitoxin family protein [Moraxella caviae]